MGSWVTYGIGSESADLPGFVVLQSGPRGPRGGAVNWGSGFLPSTYQGVPLRGGGEPILNLATPRGDLAATASAGRSRRRRVESIPPRRHGRPRDRDADHRLRGRLPDADQRPGADRPGLGDRRDAEDVRHRAGQAGASPPTACSPAGWWSGACDSSSSTTPTGTTTASPARPSPATSTKSAATSTSPCAALIKDLKTRGLLDSTLVVWGGEFGRTPMGEIRETVGRNHHIDSMTMWLAGGGVKSGLTLGETDEFGFAPVADRVHMHDLQATILHLLGLDHTRLTFRFQGRDFRLTDVAGQVVTKLLA